MDEERVPADHDESMMSIIAARHCPKSFTSFTVPLKMHIERFDKIILCFAKAQTIF
jgi:hypothetical protein